MFYNACFFQTKLELKMADQKWLSKILTLNMILHLQYWIYLY